MTGDGRNPKWRIKLTEAVQEGQRGLAVVIYNSYAEISRRLRVARKCGKDMIKTFKNLQFAVLDVHNAKKDELQEIFQEVACYTGYPKEYDCFAIAFVGRSDKSSSLLDFDGNGFNLERVIVQRFNHCEISDTIKEACIFGLIDACQERGGKNPPRPQHLPNNMKLYYSSSDDKKGGIWMQELAKQLEQKNEYVSSIVAGVNRKMENHNPVIFGDTAVDIILYKGGPDDSGADKTDGPGRPRIESDGSGAEKACSVRYSHIIAAIIFFIGIYIGYFFTN